MEPQKLENVDQIIQVSASLGTGCVSKAACNRAPCVFIDAEATSKDARERSSSKKKLLLAVTLSLIFMSVEVVGGMRANSLAILADAAHLLSDVASFAISLFSLWAAGWGATTRKSYGYLRIEILGALALVQLIWILAATLVYKAIVRLMHENGTGEVQGSLMFMLSTLGLIVNIVIALTLTDHHGHGHHGHHENHHDHVHHDHVHHDHVHHDHVHCEGSTSTESLLTKSNVGEEEKKPLNLIIQGAYLHAIGDSIQSIGVMVGAAIIWYKPEWKIIDLVCTLIFSVVVLWTTINMLRNILNVLMESTPDEIDPTMLHKGLSEMEEVLGIHELHVWAITMGKLLLSCHVVVKPGVDTDMVLDKVIQYINREFGIRHVTIQIERD